MCKKIYLYILFLGLFLYSRAQFDFNKSTIQYDYAQMFNSLTSDSLSIDDVIKNSNIWFKKEQKYKFYQKFRDSTFWLKVPVINPHSEKHNFYFVFENAYLKSADFWIKKENGELKKGFHRTVSNISKNPQYSNYPTWKFELNSNERAIVFVKIIDRDVRTKLNFDLFSDRQLINYNLYQLGSFIFFVIFISVISFIIISYSYATKSWYLLFYLGYLVFYITDFAGLKGISQTYFWSNIPYLINSSRSLSHLFIGFFGSLFFLKFYENFGDNKFVRFYFKYFAISLSFFLVIYLIKIFLNNAFLDSIYLYLWSFLNANFIIIFVIHVFLALKKKVPVYMAVAFGVPIVLSQIRNHVFTHHQMNPFLVWFVNNGYFIGVVIEVTLLSYFIVQIISNQMKLGKRAVYEYEELKQDFKNLKLEVKEKIINNTTDILKLKSNLIVNINNVISIKSDGHYVEFIFLNNQNKEIDRQSLKNIEDILSNNDNIMRVHKSYLINISHIKSINSSIILMKNGHEIPVSRKYKQNLDEIYKKHNNNAFE